MKPKLVVPVLITSVVAFLTMQVSDPSGGLQWLINATLVLVFALAAINSLAFAAIVIFWDAHIDEESGKTVFDRMNEKLDESADATLDYVNSFLAMRGLTDKILIGHFPYWVFLTHILLSGVIVWSFYTYGWSWLAVILIFIEVVSYNCIWWMAKNYNRISLQAPEAVIVLRDRLKANIADES